MSLSLAEKSELQGTSGSRVIVVFEAVWFCTMFINSNLPISPDSATGFPAVLLTDVKYLFRMNPTLKFKLLISIGKFNKSSPLIISLLLITLPV